MERFISPMTIDRLGQTAFGLAITLLPLLVLAGAHWVIVPEIVARVPAMTPEETSWAVSFGRSILPQAYAFPVTMIVLYWLMIAAFGKGDVLRFKAANVTLTLSIISISLMALLDMVLTPDFPPLAKICSLLGIPQTDWPPGFDTQSSCDRFSYIAIPTMWVFLPALLLTASAGLRIFSSRRSWQANVC